MHAHNVYFTLKDKSVRSVSDLLSDSRKYLAPIDGIVTFACGVREQGCLRPVNDTDFDVSLHIVFTDKPAHDAYQTAELHEEYVSRNRANWAQVRVFDSQLADDVGKL